jgi:hypothetical protein
MRTSTAQKGRALERTNTQMNKHSWANMPRLHEVSDLPALIPELNREEGVQGMETGI